MLERGDRLSSGGEREFRLARKLKARFEFPMIRGGSSKGVRRGTAVAEAKAEPRERIVAVAREGFFAHGYSAFTMDGLATALGMSKKTLYVYFRGKDELVRAIFDGFGGEIRAAAEKLLADRGLSFAEKLREFAGEVMARLGQVRPEILADLQQSAPELHRHIEQLREKHLPYIFGRFVEEGQSNGAVRDDVSPVFAGEFYLQAMQGLLQPATLQRLRLRPEQAFDGGLGIFFGGVLTPRGQKDYEKLFQR